MSLTVTITLAGVLVAVLGLLFQIQRSRFSMSVDLTLKLDERFNGEHFCMTRKRAAKAILKKEYSEADNVFDFFETLGLLLRRGALDREMVWSTFFYWIHRYWIAGSEYILAEQRTDPSTWADFKLLHDDMIVLEKKKTGTTDSELQLSANAIVKFLKDESLHP